VSGIRPAMAASELRRKAETFLELNDLRSRIEHQLRPNETMESEVMHPTEFGPAHGTCAGPIASIIKEGNSDI
jgi:hypothetical protein